MGASFTSEMEREYLTLSVRHLKHGLSLIILHTCPINGPVTVADMPCRGEQGGVCGGHVPGVALGGSVCPGHRHTMGSESFLSFLLVLEISKQVLLGFTTNNL